VAADKLDRPSLPAVVHLTAEYFPYARTGGLVIGIADTGIGMTPEEIPIALNRFSQIDNRLSRRYEGAGLGLPLAKHLIELHGGTLKIAMLPNCATSSAWANQG